MYAARFIRTQSRSPRGTGGACSARAFTLVELMIVIVILGILAAIVIPQFSNASQAAREATLKDDMRFLRAQTQVYLVQHNDCPPGYPGGDRTAAPTEGDFVDQMTLYTDLHGNTNASFSTVFKFGPYLSRMPQNPINGQSGIFIVGNGSPLPDASTLPLLNGSTPYGWIYKPQTQEWMANLAGNDLSGTAYSTY